MDMAGLRGNDGEAIDLQMMCLNILPITVMLFLCHQLADLHVKVIHWLDELMVTHKKATCQD